MLKHVLLANAFAIAAPAFAQDAPAQDTTPPAEAQTPPAAETTEPAPAKDTTTPVDDAAEPATPAQPAEPATPAEPASPAQPATTPDNPPQSAAQEPKQATPEQIAQLVDKDFATYDKDGNGSLSNEEFGAWMVALRSATEPAFTGQSAADKDWIGKALASADADKSGGVSNAELKGFLAPNA